MAGEHPRDAVPLIARAEEVQTYFRSLFAQRPDDARPPFVIFAQGRSGSRLLVDLLNSHPDIICEREILYHRRLLPVRYAIGREAATRPDTVYGFKVKIYQLEYVQNYESAADFLDALTDRNWKLVHLWRQDIFRQCISARMAWQKNLWHANDQKQDQVDQTVHMDAEKLASEMRSRIQYREQEKAILDGREHLEINYEEDLSTPQAQQRTLNDIFEYLGLDAHPVSTNMKKTSKRHLSDQISNYDEVIETVAKQGLAQYLP